MIKFPASYFRFPLYLLPMMPKSSSQSGLNLTLFSIPQSLLLQIGTASILLLLSAEKSTSQALQALGEASEEVFRGNSLPILHFPENHEVNDQV